MNKHAIVYGGTGVVGAAFCYKLLEKGYDIDIVTSSISSSRDRIIKWFEKFSDSSLSPDINWKEYRDKIKFIIDNEFVQYLKEESLVINASISMHGSHDRYVNYDLPISILERMRALNRHAFFLEISSIMCHDSICDTENPVNYYDYKKMTYDAVVAEKEVPSAVIKLDMAIQEGDWGKAYSLPEISKMKFPPLFFSSLIKFHPTVLWDLVQSIDLIETKDNVPKIINAIGERGYTVQEILKLYNPNTIPLDLSFLPFSLRKKLLSLIEKGYAHSGVLESISLYSKHYEELRTPSKKDFMFFDWLRSQNQGTHSLENLAEKTTNLPNPWKTIIKDLFFNTPARTPSAVDIITQPTPPSSDAAAQVLWAFGQSASIQSKELLSLRTL